MKVKGKFVVPIAFVKKIHRNKGTYKNSGAILYFHFR